MFTGSARQGRPSSLTEAYVWAFSEYLEIGIYKAKCIVYTQDDVIVEDETADITMSGGTVVGVLSATATYDYTNKAVDVEIVTDGSQIGQVTCHIYRQSVNDENDINIRLVGKIEVYNRGKFKDYLIANNKSYRYYIIASNSEQRFIGGASNIIDITDIDNYNKIMDIIFAVITDNPLIFFS